MTDPADRGARIRPGAATSQGPNRPLNADAHARYSYRGTFAAAVVDGIGSTPEVADFARATAAVAARMAARETSVIGVVAAATPYTDLDDDSTELGGAIVVASVRAGEDWRIAYAGPEDAPRPVARAAPATR